MKDEYIPKTTFQNRYGHCEFLVMSFGLTNAHAVLIDLMNRVFRNYLDSFVIVFIDNIFLYSKDEVDNIGHLRVLLQTLKENQSFAKYRLCVFWLWFVTFLGHVISSKGVEVD